MSDGLWVVLIFWGVWAAEGFNRFRRRRFNLSGSGLGGPARLQFGSLLWFWPLPHGWRYWAMDIPFVFSPEGLANRPSGGAGRPADPALAVRTATWREALEAEDRQGWICLGGQPFGPVHGAFEARFLRQLAARIVDGPAAEMAQRTELEIRRLFGASRWRRRHRLLLGRTRLAAWANGCSLATALLLTPLVLPAAWDLPEPVLERIFALAPGLALIGLTGYVTGLAAAHLAIRKLRPWLEPTVRAKFWQAVLFPPQALRWRSLMTETCATPAHPLALAAALGAPREVLAEMGFNSLADLRWPGLSPHFPLTPEADRIRRWWADRTRLVVEQLLRDQGLDPQALLRPPAPDSQSSRYYCPRCRDQFSSPHGQCPRGTALLPMAEASTPEPDASPTRQPPA